MSTAMDQRFHADCSIVPHIKRPATFWPVELVGRQRSQVEVIALDIKRHFAGCLHSIRMEQHATLATKLSDLFDRLEHAGFIIGSHDRDQNGLISEGVPQLVETDQAILLDW